MNCWAGVGCAAGVSRASTGGWGARGDGVNGGGGVVIMVVVVDFAATFTTAGVGARVVMAVSGASPTAKVSDGNFGPGEGEDVSVHSPAAKYVEQRRKELAF